MTVVIPTIGEDNLVDLINEYYWGGNTVPFVAGQVADLLKSKYEQSQKLKRKYNRLLERFNNLKKNNKRNSKEEQNGSGSSSNSSNNKLGD